MKTALPFLTLFVIALALTWLATAALGAFLRVPG
jgi:hypothetical protein